MLCNNLDLWRKQGIQMDGTVLCCIRHCLCLTLISFYCELLGSSDTSREQVTTDFDSAAPRLSVQTHCLLQMMVLDVAWPASHPLGKVWLYKWTSTSFADLENHWRDKQVQYYFCLLYNPTGAELTKTNKQNPKYMKKDISRGHQLIEWKPQCQG